MIEKKNGYKDDVGFSSGCMMQRQRFLLLCQQFKDSEEFKNFCATNKEFRTNVYKHNFGYEFDMIVCGRYGDDMSSSYPLASGTILSTPSQVGCDYTVSWRGIFTCDVDIKMHETDEYSAYEPEYDVTQQFTDENGNLYFKAIPKSVSNSGSPLAADC